MDIPPPPPPVPAPPPPGAMPLSPMVRPSAQELPGAFPLTLPIRGSIPMAMRSHPYPSQAWNNAQPCPAQHLRPTGEKRVYECHVLRRSSSSSSKQLSWRNRPHTTVRHITEEDFKKLKSMAQKGGAAEVAEVQYDKLKHSSMRDAVDYVIEWRNAEERTNSIVSQWLWKPVLVQTEQRCIGNSLLPTKFETYQIRLVLQRVLRPEIAPTVNQTAGSIGANYPHPQLQPPAQPFNYAHMEQQNPYIRVGHAGYSPAGEIGNGARPDHPPYNQGMITEAEARDEAGSEGESSRASNPKTKAAPKQKKKKQKKLMASESTKAQFIDQLLRATPSDSGSDSDSHIQEGKLRHRRRHRPKAPIGADPWGNRSDWMNPVDYSSAEDGNEYGGYMTPPTSISDDGSMVQDGYSYPYEPGYDDGRRYPQSHRSGPSGQHMSTRASRDFSTVPKQPHWHGGWASEARRHSHRRPENGERMAYIAGREAERQLGRHRPRAT